MTDVLPAPVDVLDTPAISSASAPSKTPSSKATKRSYDTFHTFIARLLRKEGDLCITQETKDLANGLIMRVATNIARYAVELVNQSEQKTISSRAFRCVAQLEYGRSDPSIAFADGVLAAFKASKVSGNNSEKAGLVLPPARFKTIIEKYKSSSQNVGGNSHIYLTALVEHMAMQVLKTSLAVTISESKRTISDLHLQTALGHSSLAAYMNAVGPIYLVPNGLYTNGGNRASFQKDLYKRIKRAQRKTRSRKAKAEADNETEE